jgi:uncharacterized protein YjbJ (UPF0337 family)
MSTADKAKNKLDKYRGRVKENLGRTTGNRRLENEGKVDQVKANVKTTGEKIKDVFRPSHRRP